MKNLLLTLTCVLALVAASVAQTNAIKNQNSLYGSWVAHSTVTTASGTATITPDFCYFNPATPPAAGSNVSGSTTSGHQFFPFATNVPVTIVDGANTETVTPSAVVSPTSTVGPALGPYNCSFTASFSNAHSSGVAIVSGDGGVAEAANDNGAAYDLANGVIFLQGACTGTTATAITGALSGWDPGTAIACTTTFAPATAGGTVMPRTGLIKGLSVTATHAGTNASSGVVTINKNGSATSITCTIGTGTSCSDSTHTVAVVAGDNISVSYTSQAADVLAGVNASALVY